MPPVKLEKEYKLTLSEKEYQYLRDLIKHGNKLAQNVAIKENDDKLTFEDRKHLSEQWDSLVTHFEIALDL